MKVSSFTRVLNVFWNCGRKVQTTFWGGEMWDQLRKILPHTSDNAMHTMHWRQEWSIKDKCDRRGE
jgi:hypothetical protein